MKRANVWWIVALLPHVGCAVLLKSDPFVPRYFSPESAATRTDPIAPSGLELRLGRVTAAAYLKERIVFSELPPMRSDIMKSVAGRRCRSPSFGER